MRLALALATLLAITPAAAKEPTQHERIEAKLDRVLQLLGERPPVAVVTPVPKPPASGINYALCRGLTPQECQGSFGPFQGRGLPAGWDWEAAFAAGLLRPPTPTGPVATGGAALLDSPSFDWAPGVWRRFVAPAAKTLAVPPGYNGVVRLEVTSLAGGTADFVRVSVMDGARVVVTDPLIRVTNGNVQFRAEGGKTYTVLVEGAGAVVSVNLLIGG